uniref:Uncharacterized protein n=1 Tax=Hucho hucho TaxID=62062 RepID=A0A4W5K441_9TELE
MIKKLELFSLTDNVKCDIVKHLSELGEQLRRYFPETDDTNNWIHYTFHVLVELKELRVLYRHDKSICNLSEVDKLGALPFLHRLTLNKNVCRGCVIAALPHLLDFCAVTGQERIMDQVWHRPSNHSKNTRKNQDN